MKPNRDDKFRYYIYTSLVGMLAGGVALPIEHPADRLKTTAQANPTFSYRQLCQYVMRDGRGFKGFYTGAVPNTMRAMLKQSYRYPMQLFFPNVVFGPLLGKDYKSGTVQVATGLAIATTETYFITPFERAKVWMMTNPDRHRSVVRGLNIGESEMWAELYRGTHAVMPKQIISWVSFLYFNQYFKAKARSITGQNDLSTPALFGVAAAVGTVNTAVVMPFDAVKTHMQKATDPQASKGALDVFRMLKDLYVSKGFRGLYAGTGPKALQYLLHGLVTVNAVEYLEVEYNNQYSTPRLS